MSFSFGLGLFNKYHPDECYLHITGEELKMPIPQWGRDSVHLMKDMETNFGVKVSRVYPANKSYIMVCRTQEDKKKILNTKKDDLLFEGKPIIIIDISNKEGERMRFQHQGGNRSWRVNYEMIQDAEDVPHDFYEKDNNKQASCCALPNPGGVAGNQFYHPRFGFLMCICCMNQLEPGDFNTCNACSSGVFRPMFVPDDSYSTLSLHKSETESIKPSESKNVLPETEKKIQEEKEVKTKATKKRKNMVESNAEQKATRVTRSKTK
jgi:hypothetical protein